MKKIIILPLLFCFHFVFSQKDTLQDETTYNKYINNKTLEVVEYSEGIEANDWSLKPYRINNQFMFLLEKKNDNNSFPLSDDEISKAIYNNNILFLYIKIDEKDVLIIPAKSNIYEKEIRYFMTTDYMSTVVNAQTISIKFSSINSKNYSDFQRIVSNDELLKIKDFGIGTKLIKD